MKIETISEQRCFDGVQGFYRHESHETRTAMRFAVYQPPQVRHGPVPVLFYLAGLTCTEETAAIKAGAQQHASQHGILLVMPDTSPRGAGIDGEDEDWDFGSGAGFYVNATMAPWSNNYRMDAYVAQELRSIVVETFSVDSQAIGIFGHSMGGHGALTLALKRPDTFRSVSAFAPICAPMQCPWGRKAFQGYFGGDQALWASHDATELIKAGHRAGPILIDQGTEDQFLAEQLSPAKFEAACQEYGQALRMRMQAGYDHSYYFIETFMADHIAHHAKCLQEIRSGRSS